jgi:FkbM family methyltransferase
LFQPNLTGKENLIMAFNLFETIKSMNLPAPVGVLQVGASYAQEMNYFIENGIRCGVFIEPLPEPYAYLSNLCSQLPNFVAVNTLCTDEIGKSYNFHVASNAGMSSSILKPARHLIENDYVSFPNTIEVVSSTVDQVISFLNTNGHTNITSNLDLMYMDTQGAEFKILLGAHKTLKSVKYIFSEIMRADLYEDQVPFLTYCTYLEAIGFTLNNLYFNPGHTGDALFIRKDLLAI